MLGRPLKVEDQDVETIIYWHSLHWPSRKIAKGLQGKYSHQTIWRTIRRFGSQRFLEHVLERKRQADELHVPKTLPKVNARDLSEEIDHYQPAMRSSFSGGLGAGTPPSVVKQIVKKNNPGKASYELRREEWNLRPHISAKDLDPAKHRLREQVVKRMKKLGYDGSSDIDASFGKLDEITGLGLTVLHNAKQNNIKLQTPKLVDALIAYVLGEKAKQLESVEMTLLCPSKRCQGKPSSSISHRSGKGVVCVRCHSFIPWSKVRFKPRLTKIDPEYYALVKRIHEESELGVNAQSVPSVLSKSFGLGVEPGPLTSPGKARNHIGVCVNESTSQSSE